MTFTSFAEVCHPLRTNVSLVAFWCGGCRSGYFAEIRRDSNITPHQYPADIEADQAAHLTIMAEYPEAQVIEAPRHLPENIESFYLQAVKSLKSGNYDAAAMMSRKVLESAVKKLNPSASSNLYKKIEALHGSGKITDDLKEWAHIIREDGNEAVHEDAIASEEFANELISFTELFLMYTFTMPGMVQERMTKSNVTSSHA